VDEEALARLQAATREVLARQPVAFAYLFGSRARGDDRTGSDTDVAVLFGTEGDPAERADRALALADDLRAALGTPVDVVVLDDAPPLLRDRVLRDRVVLFRRDEPLRVAWESRAYRLGWDFAPRGETMARDYLAAVARGEA